MTITKSVRINEFGVYAFPANLSETISGRTVTVRDLYTERSVIAVAGEVEIGLNGYPCAVELTLQNGRHIPAFSLHGPIEIEVH